MFGSCFLKLILTIVFENNILGPICLQFLKTIFLELKILSYWSTPHTNLVVQNSNVVEIICLDIVLALSV